MSQESTMGRPPAEEKNDAQQETSAPVNTMTEIKGEEGSQQQPPVHKAGADNNAASAGKDNEKTKEKEEPGEEYGKKFEVAELWEQIRTHTKKIEIDENSEFFWPERREHTEKVIQQLLTKRILFIRSVSEDWLYPAVQRLASVLQSNGSPENLLLRITKTWLSTNSSVKEKFEFGFWVNQHRLPYPVVIFISADRQDFVQKFLSLTKETVQNDVFTDLKNANLFIVCETEENLSNRELFDRHKKRASENFAIWNVPCTKLHITKHLKKNSELFLQQLDEKGLVTQYSERSLYEGLTGIDVESEREMENIFIKLQEFGSDIEKKRTQLIDIMRKDDFINKVVVFCGAFFNGLYYPDFYNLVSALLLDEKENDILNQADLPEGTRMPVTARLLSDIWERNADQILQNCFLKTKKEGGSNRVDFVLTRLADIMANYIEEEQYPFFHRIYRNFEKTGLLTNPYLNEKIEPHVIRFFALAAKLDIPTHNARWLKNVVYGLWKLYETDLPVNTSYDELLQYLRRQEKIAPIIFSRIPLIIGGLLRNNNEHFREIITEFFRLLLNEPDAKKMAIIIASYLYRDNHYTDTFSTEEFIGYFRRTLDEGNWEESFFAYDALTESMSYLELHEQTKKWIDDKEISDASWTKQFAFLYQVDFVLVTVYRYFRQFKGEVAYELWCSGSDEKYPDSFKLLVKDLLSEKCFTSLEVIFSSTNGYKRFVYFVGLFEAVESGKALAADERFESVNNESFTLIADILETWFYILTHKRDLLKEDSVVEEKWKEYVEIIVEYCDKRYFRMIRKYWANKLRFYSLEVEILKDAGRESKRKTDPYRDQLRKRKNSLKTLTHLILSSRSSN